MIYHQLFEHLAQNKTVRAGVVGTGNYATAIVTQSFDISRLEIPIVADINLGHARLAFERAGFTSDDIVECESRKAALAAMERGKKVILEDALLMMDLPLDVIAEATGSAEAGALHASAAIHHGKHVAMVTKEGDVTVGPILKHLADQAGVVYTAVDGDQPGLLIGLVSWARELGLEVVCGGKFRDAGLILDESTGTLTQRNSPVLLSDEAKRFLAPISPGQAGIISPRRLAVLGEMGEILHHDHEELTIVANATGLVPDIETLHHPVLRTVEIPEVLCPVEDRGILESRGTVDVVTCLRHTDEPGGGGGVFVVVSPASEYSRYFLGLDTLSNRQGSAFLIYRPYHLCGVETAMSILCASLLGLPTGAIEYLPHFDVITQVVTSKKAGEVLDYEDVRTLIRPAGAVEDGAPLPLNMALWNKLAVDVPVGTFISKNELIPPTDSVLWKLRREQDNLFRGM